MNTKRLAADLNLIKKFASNSETNKEEVETRLIFSVSTDKEPTQKEINKLSYFYYVAETKQFILEL
jgi:hypothetical protein